MDGNAQAPLACSPHALLARSLSIIFINICSVTFLWLVANSQWVYKVHSTFRVKVFPTDLDNTIFGLNFPTDSQIHEGPSLGEKIWHLNWIPFAFLASFRPQRQPTRICVNCFLSNARVTSDPSHFGVLSCCHTHATCLSELHDFVLNQYGDSDYVPTCNRHTGDIAGHDHVDSQLTRFPYGFCVVCLRFTKDTKFVLVIDFEIRMCQLIESSIFSPVWFNRAFACMCKNGQDKPKGECTFWLFHNTSNCFSTEQGQPIE